MRIAHPGKIAGKSSWSEGYAVSASLEMASALPMTDTGLENGDAAGNFNSQDYCHIWNEVMKGQNGPKTLHIFLSKI